MRRVRYRPPRTSYGPELRWLLRAAFAHEAPDPPPLDGTGPVLELARRLGLRERIWARHRVAAASLRLPRAVEPDFRKAFLDSAVRTALHEDVARRIASTAEAASIPIVFLKGFALHICGRDQAGGRPFGDLDLLAPEDAAEELHARLLDNGFELEYEAGNEQHLATLVSRDGAKVDLHFCIRGLALAPRRWATYEDLASQGLLEPASPLGSGAATATLDIQTAHLLVHGLAHHLWRPQRYPLLRLFGDLDDLLPDRASWDRFLARNQRILAVSVPDSELLAARGLAEELRLGRLTGLDADDPDSANLLLRHIVAGSLDDDYGPSLRARHSLGRLGDAARQGRLVQYIARKLRRQTTRMRPR